MLVAEYITNFFIEKNIKHVFGFQGGAILKILDTMVESGKIQYIQGFHEQASSFCADAYSRVSNDIGVAIATSGPGATNLINGIANAHFDSIPTIFITGQDYTVNIEKPESVRQNGFQDLDITTMVKPITKYATTIKNPNDIRFELEKAYYLAKHGRGGAVLLDIPIDIQFAEIDHDALHAFIPEKPEFDLSRIDDVVQAIKKAEKPVILAGGGIRLAHAVVEFDEFVDKTGIPIVSTLNGLDVHKDSLGFAGLHGNSNANLTVLKADLIIALGTRLGQRQVGKKVENYTKAKIIHVDIDEGELGRAVEEDISILADVKTFLKHLNEKIKQTSLPNFSAWAKKNSVWKEKYYRNTYLNKTMVDPVAFVNDISFYFAPDAVITADVGQNQMWVAQGIRLNGKQRLLNSSGFGSMGYSLPAAIGASYVTPETAVIAFTGDGGLQMNLQELNTLAIMKRNVKCIVFNNNTLGMMREVQARYYNSHYIGANDKEFTCPDLKALANAFGLKYLEITNNSQIAEFKSILDDTAPYLVDVKIQQDSILLNRYDDTVFSKEDGIDG